MWAWLVPTIVVCTSYSSADLADTDRCASAHACDDDDDVAFLQSRAQLKDHHRSSGSPLTGCVGFQCIEQYVNLPDGSYHWEDTGVRLQGSGSEFDEVGVPAVPWTGYVLNMTSHTWPNHVSHPVWWHTLVIIDPSNREIDDLATLFLDFGIEDGNETTIVITNRKAPPAGDPNAAGFMSLTKEQLKHSQNQVFHAVQKAVYLATRTKARTASLLNCPNAYEVFADDELQVYRSADVLKGYTYGNFLEHSSEPERIMELPVAKSVVRAMDTITQFTNGAISRFAVTGFSKLGTATYIAAALDDRVEVFVPIAIYLNFANSGGRGPPLSPEEYEEELETATDEFHNMRDQQYSLAVFHAKAQTPEWQKLHEIMDPSAWLSRLAKPKLCVMSSSDNVLGRLILDEPALLQPFMPGLTRFLEVPNTAHFNTLISSLPTSSAFLRGFLLGLSPPDISYTLDRAGRVIRVQQVSNHTPVEVKMWHREILLWDERQVQATYPGSGAWLAQGDEMQGPGQDGGMFVELTYNWPEPGFQFKISTPVMSYTPASLFSN